MNNQWNHFVLRCTCIVILSLTAAVLVIAPPAGRADTVYVTATSGGWMGDIFKFAPDGTRSVFVSFHAYNSQTPYGMAFDASGNLYAASYYGNTITKYSPGGVGTLFANTGIAYPQGIAFNGAGSLFVAEYNA